MSKSLNEDEVHRPINTSNSNIEDEFKYIKSNILALAGKTN
jgi:hypothetical protein